MEFLRGAYPLSFEGIQEGVYKYRFISEGDEDIVKVISISPISFKENWYNLGFGNLENNEGEVFVNDTSERNNNDFDRVLATVFMATLNLFSLRPNATVLFFGNTEHKHRIYKQKISANITALKEELKISGGVTNVKADIIETKQKITRNGRVRERVIKSKDLDSIPMNIQVEKIEDYKVSNSKAYQFVLIELKKIN